MKQIENSSNDFMSAYISNILNLGGLSAYEINIPKDIISFCGRNIILSLFGIEQSCYAVSWSEFLKTYCHPDDSKMLLKGISDIAYGASCGDNSVRIKKMSTPQWRLVYACANVATRDQSGSLELIQGMLVDVTGNNLQIKEPETVSDRFEDMLERIPLACIVINEDSSISQCNQEAVRLLGASDKQDILTSLFTKYSADVQADGQDSVTASRKILLNNIDKADSRFEWLHRHASGEIIPTEIILRSADFGGKRQIIAYGRDLRDIKQGILALQEQQRELIAARDLAQASERSKTAFLANMSHEIRTPMTAIIGMTAVAKKSGDIEKMTYCLEKVSDASDHLLGVINDILDMSKIESGKFVLSPTDFNLESMLARIADMMTYRINEKHQSFMIKVDNDVPKTIVSDQQRLTQVIMNLLSNANKFTSDDGEITLHISLAEPLQVATREAKLLIRVIDNGIGIDPDKIGSLFQSFEQADNTISRRFGGTGLGLAISKTIVELMRGEISVTSTPGNGSIFAFTMMTRQGIANSVTRIDPDIDLSTINIMVVDDAQIVLEYFSDIVTGVGIACRTAQSGAEAFKLVEEKKPDIMFIDWLMPEMDGIELTRQIRRKYGDGVVIIMVSASDWSEIQESAHSVGIDKFISKPLLASPIIDCINECLGGRAAMVDLPSDNEDEEKEIFKGKRLLMAEDVEINSEIVIAMTEGMGLEIVVAENGRIACEKFKSEPLLFDMILMDVHMPEMDGYEAARQIRKMNFEKAKKIPIVAMTANVFKEDVDRCLAAGMNDHLPKPINFSAFTKTLKKYLKR